MASPVTFTQVIKNRGFLNLWLNQILVQLSYNSLNFALIIWVFRLTDSNIAVSALIFAIFLPAVIFGLLTGVLVDIIDRKKIIMAINILLALAFFSLIFFKESFPAILAITFLVNALGQFYALAESSAIPIIARRDELITANVIFSVTLYSSFLLGFGMSGPLINHLGIDMVFTLGGVFLALAFLFSIFFPSIAVEPDQAGRKLILALKQKNLQIIKEIGFSEITDTIRLVQGKLPVLSSILILAGVQAVIGILGVLMPGFLEKSLQIKATDASYILVVPLGLGLVAGGLILGKIGYSLIKRRLVGRAIIFAGLLFFLVGVAPIISPAIRHLPKPQPLPFFYQLPLSKILIIGSFLLGMCLVSILVPSQTVLQQNTPNKDRAKIFSVLGVVMSALSLIPVLLSGVLADIFGTTPIFIALGAVIILVGLFALKPSLFFSKQSLPYHVRQFLGLKHWEGE